MAKTKKELKVQLQEQQVKLTKPFSIQIEGVVICGDKGDTIKLPINEYNRLKTYYTF